MYCPYCGRENEDDETVCISCEKDMSNYIPGEEPFKLLCPHHEEIYYCDREHCQKFISCFREELSGLYHLGFKQEYNQLLNEIKLGAKRRFVKKEINPVTSEEILKQDNSIATSPIPLQIPKKQEPVKINKPV